MGVRHGNMVHLKQLLWLPTVVPEQEPIYTNSRKTCACTWVVKRSYDYLRTADNEHHHMAMISK